MDQTKTKLLYPDLTFKLNGCAILVRKEIGRFGKEKQYSDLFEIKLKESNIPYKREVIIGDSGNRIDFVAYDKVAVEMKAKPFITKEDYFQVQRYLHATNLELGIIYNFREQFVKPHRILRVSNFPQTSVVSG